MSDFTEDAPRTHVRQICQRCHKIDRVSFIARDKEMWKRVAGPAWVHSILCIACYAELGDEKGLDWAAGGLDFWPRPYVIFDAQRREWVKARDGGSRNDLSGAVQGPAGGHRCEL